MPSGRAFGLLVPVEVFELGEEVVGGGELVAADYGIIIGGGSDSSGLRVFV